MGDRSDHLPIMQLHPHPTRWGATLLCLTFNSTQVRPSTTTGEGLNLTLVSSTLTD
ncbi:hypothetical protein E2C01_088897 [Portunus trituberculatus]|uniref:Uncharacterized protein n=1 Tax=Portunus trituberculatus TaxID=210409 RepID=A0A5B7JHP3_PORTR|nr:hypothetical protein [Portunus trituberculatus]